MPKAEYRSLRLIANVETIGILGGSSLKHLTRTVFWLLVGSAGIIVGAASVVGSSQDWAVWLEKNLRSDIWGPPLGFLVAALSVVAAFRRPKLAREVAELRLISIEHAKLLEKAMAAVSGRSGAHESGTDGILLDSLDHALRRYLADPDPRYSRIPALIADGQLSEAEALASRLAAESEARRDAQHSAAKRWADVAAISSFSDPNRAIEHYERAIELGDDRLRTATNLISLYLDLGDADSAERLLNRSTDWRNDGDENLQGSFELSQGNLAHLRGNIPKAREHLLAALKIAEKTNNVGVKSGSLSTLALVEAVRNVDDAIKLLEQALACSTSIGHREFMAKQNGNLGLLHRQNGNEPLARKHQATALELFRSTDNVVGQAGTLLNLGILEAESGNYEIANRHYSDALELNRIAGRTYGQALCLGNMGNVAINLGKRTEAQSLYFAALDLYDSINMGGCPAATNTRNNLANLMARPR